MNIEILINAPALAGAISELAAAIKLHAETHTVTENGEILIPKGTQLTVADVEPVDIVEEPEKPKARKRTTKKAAEAPQIAPTEPVADTAPATPAAPQAAAESTVEAPAETKPVPTMAEIAAAGAQLLDKDPNIMPALLALLSDYGVQAITQLKDDQLAGFAGKLRELGAEV